MVEAGIGNSKQERGTDSMQSSLEQVIVTTHSGRSVASHAPIDAVELPESQAALRQFSLERIIAYGVNYSDAMELRGRVCSGERWQAVAADLAESCVNPPERRLAPETAQTRANRLFRSSALWRMSQAMMLKDSAERIEIFSRSAKLYDEASKVAGDRQRVIIESANGPMVGWLHKSALQETVGRVLMIGGFEGWGMDCGEAGVALGARGIEALALDGPGHGETRMVYEHFMTAEWEVSYKAAIDFLQERGPEPIGVFGLSAGGSLATHLAARDQRLSACVNNGGFSVPHRVRFQKGAAAANKGSSFFQKVAAHCGNVTDDEAEAIWRTVEPIDPSNPIRCPYLIVHSKIDPLITDDDVNALLESAQTSDKHMVVFPDGLHCIYNHSEDKYNLVADWFASRLKSSVS